MRVSTTLEHIQEIQAVNQKILLNEKEKKEVYNNYISFLKNEIKDEINIIFLKYKNYYNYNDIYNYILTNKDNIIKKIEKIALNESKKHYKIIVDDSDKWAVNDKKVYLWDDFNIVEDIEIYFFKILKEEKSKDLQQEQANYNIKLSELYQVFYNYLINNKNNNINDVIAFLISKKNYIIKNLGASKKEKNFLSLNFSKILKKAVNDTKIYYKLNNKNVDDIKKINYNNIKILIIISVMLFIIGYYIVNF